MTDVDVVINLRSQLGEGPVWDHRIGRLAWLDILEGFVHLTEVASGRTESIEVGAPVGALALHGDGDYLLAIRNGFARLSGVEVSEFREAFEPGNVRMNDGSVDLAGRFLAGSMGDGESPVGSLYGRDVDGTIRTLFADVTISNGIAWSSDGSLMYFIDSARQSVDVMGYDLAEGNVIDRRTWVEIPESHGTPDGMTIDSDGCVWVALWDGGKVRRYSPAGEVMSEIAVPTARTTSCAFGGPDLDRLFITTAAVGIDPTGPGADLAGAVFVADPGCTGVAEAVVPA